MSSMECNRPAKPSLFVNVFLTPLALLLAGCAGPAILSHEIPEPPPVAAKPTEPPVITPNPDVDVAVDITFDIFKANAALKRGDYAEALKLYRIELLKEQALPEPRWEQLAYLNNQLGFGLNRVAQFDKALEYYQKSLAIRLKQLGPDHRHVALNYNSIGQGHRAKGEYDKALEYHQKSLAITLKRLGPDHPDVASSYNNIGAVHDHKGEHKKALEFYRKSLAIMLKRLGPDHMNVAIACCNIANVLSEQAQPDLPQAHQLINRSEAIIKKTHGQDTPWLAFTHNARGRIFYEQSQHPKALAEYAKAEPLAFRLFGKSHPNTARLYYYQGRAHRALKQNPQAKALFQTALAIQIKKPGPHHRDTQRTQAALDALTP